MVRKVSVYTAKIRFAQLLRKVRLGQEVIVLKAGKPVAKLVPLEMLGKAARPLGLFKLGLSPEAIAESLRPLDEKELKLWEGDENDILLRFKP